jgi:hypothetical protein
MTSGPEEELIEGKFTAALDLLGRTGVDEFTIRFCEEEEPTVWMAVAHWPERPGLVIDHSDATGALTPWLAVLRLCEAAVDGGTCIHCHKPTGIDDKPADELDKVTEAFICWYRYDPEMKTFRRSCEGVN